MFCEGPWNEYVENYGKKEFVPIENAKLVNDLLKCFSI